MSDLSEQVRRINQRYPVRIRDAADDAEALVNPLNMAINVAQRRGDNAMLAAIEAIIANIEKVIDEAKVEFTRVTKTERAAVLPQDEQAEVVLAGLVALAKAKSAILAPIDTLHGFMLEHAPKVTRAFFEGMPEMRLSGWLRKKEVIERAATRGILTWFGADQRHRIVDTTWLTSHGQIRRFVLEDFLRGRRCRFCRLDEPQTADNLIMLWVNEQQPLASLNANDRAIESRGMQGYAHAQCLPFWHNWLAIAKQYQTDEAADEADLAAGRSTVEAPAPPAYKPDPVPEIPEGYIESRPIDYDEQKPFPTVRRRRR